VNYETIILEAIQKSFENYQKFGARSNKKLIPLHLSIKTIIENIFGNHFEYFSLPDKEYKVKGKYYDKDVDIVAIKNDKVIFGIGIKFVTSNYKQNANNYFENMLGETANIQANKIPYFQFIVLRYKTPYYDKSGDTKKIETITQKDLQKYINLVVDNPQAHIPKAIGIILIDINDKITTHSLNEFDKSFIELFNQKLSFKSFIQELKNYKNFLDLKEKI